MLRLISTYCSLSTIASPKANTILTKRPFLWFYPREVHSSNPVDFKRFGLEIETTNMFIENTILSATVCYNTPQRY
jgi:hypothetical protein